MLAEATAAAATDENDAGSTVKQSKELRMIYEMRNEFGKHRWRASTAGGALVLCALLATGSIDLCLAASGQPTFASADDAGRALVSAVQKHDERTVTGILGGGSELINSNNQIDDTLDRDRFVQKYQEMHRFVREPGGITTLYIGAENWPFPVPLVSRHGTWQFESKAGAEEIRFRRIGENEVMAIGMSATLVVAETLPGSDSEADRLVTTLLPQVRGAGKAILLRGYYFRILSNSEGRVSAIAYPAMYRSSGVMTFIATQNGGVTEKDLGPNTAKIAAAMTGDHADASWTAAE
jgi:Protein of unknown function (DUF2950)